MNPGQPEASEPFEQVVRDAVEGTSSLLDAIEKQRPSLAGAALSVIQTLYTAHSIYQSRFPNATPTIDNLLAIYDRLLDAEILAIELEDATETD